jgi:hypothetical protein
MQHYGLPTRLLDWSREALVALLFALGEPVNDVERNHDKVVWVLDPVRLNKAFRFYKFLKPGYIPNVTEPAFNALFGPNAKNRERMNRQLQHYGLTEHDLFPGIQNVAADITQELIAEGLLPERS